MNTCERCGKQISEGTNIFGLLVRRPDICPECCTHDDIEYEGMGYHRCKICQYTMYY